MSLLKVEFLSPTGAVLISRIKQQLVKNRVSGNPGVTLFHLFELTALFLELLPPFNLTSASPQVCQANQRFQALLTRYRKKARSFRFLQRVKEEKLTEQKRKLLREKMSTRANELYWILCGMQQYLTSLLLSSPSPQKGSASERPVFDGFSRKKKKVPTTGEKKQKQGSFAQVLLDLRSRSLLSPNEISSRFQRFRERKPSPPVTSLEKHETFWLLFHVLTLSPYDSSIVQAVFIDQVFSPHFLLGVSETYETKGFMDRLVRRLEEQTKKFQKVRDTQFCVGIFSTLLQNYSKTVEGQVIAEYLETDIYAQSAFFTINCSPLFLDKTNTIRNSMYEDNIRRNPFQKKKHNQISVSDIITNQIKLFQTLFHLTHRGEALPGNEVLDAFLDLDRSPNPSPLDSSFFQDFATGAVGLVWLEFYECTKDVTQGFVSASSESDSVDPRYIKWLEREIIPKSTFSSPVSKIIVCQFRGFALYPSKFQLSSSKQRLATVFPSPGQLQFHNPPPNMSPPIDRNTFTRLLHDIMLNPVLENTKQKQKKPISVRLPIYGVEEDLNACLPLWASAGGSRLCNLSGNFKLDRFFVERELLFYLGWREFFQYHLASSKTARHSADIRHCVETLEFIDRHINETRSKDQKYRSRPDLL